MWCELPECPPQDSNNSEISQVVEQNPKQAMPLVRMFRRSGPSNHGLTNVAPAKIWLVSNASW